MSVDRTAFTSHNQQLSVSFSFATPCSGEEKPDTWVLGGQCDRCELQHGQGARVSPALILLGRGEGIYLGRESLDEVGERARVRRGGGGEGNRPRPRPLGRTTATGLPFEPTFREISHLPALCCFLPSSPAVGRKRKSASFSPLGPPGHFPRARRRD
jgi:hypothetical protein